MVTDQIADLLTRIRNAASAGHVGTSVPASKTKRSILKLLESEGYIAGFQEVEKDGKKSLKVALRYTEDGKPVIREIKRLSKPGRRVYVGYGEIPRFKGGLGTVVLSSSKGLMTDRQARAERVGGELIFSVF